MSLANGTSLNQITLRIFAPVLILVGILGFVLPSNLSVTSGATAYNIFHLIFGAIGIAIALQRNESWARAFCVGFGAIDLYQALASYVHLFPESQFAWTRIDDLLHVVVGAALVAIGLAPSLRGARPG